MGHKYRVAVIVLIGLSIVLPITLFTQLMLNSEEFDRRFEKFHPRMLATQNPTEASTTERPAEKETPWVQYAQDEDEETTVRRKKKWHRTTRNLDFVLIRVTTMPPIELPEIVFETIKPRPFLYGAAPRMHRYGALGLVLVCLNMIQLF